MSALSFSLIAFIIIMAGVFVGALSRRALPKHHLDEDAKDVVRLGTGLIGTIAALVLGLLIASAKSSYDTQSGQVQHITARSRPA
jgi:fluoride ion exporter CrcB/FEX